MEKKEFDFSYRLKDVYLSCVYFLLNRGKVVYVGKTEKGLLRILSHCTNKVFDEIRIKKVALSKLDEAETKYIAEYNPKYNSLLTNAYSSTRIKQILKTEYNVVVLKREIDRYIASSVRDYYMFNGNKYISKKDLNKCISNFIE